MNYEFFFQQKLFILMLFKAWMHNIKNVIKIILYLAQCTCIMGIKNAKHRKIDQHKNVMCQMESLDKTLTLTPLVLFSMFAPMELTFTNECRANF